MILQIKPLEDDFRSTLEDKCAGVYLQPECYAFAIALHRGIGWPIIAIKVNGILQHAAVLQPDGSFRDARGVIEKKDEGDFVAPFTGGAPYDIITVSEASLLHVRPVHDISIERASLMAEVIWPNLPWKMHTLQQRSRNFLNELGLLCEKYGVWIRSSVPNAGIVLENSHGDEGFAVQPMLTMQYMFDRVLGQDVLPPGD
jgi:hypothetical protein